MKLSDLNIGESGYIVKVGGSAAFRKRITEMGFVRGQKISVLFASPLGNPVTYSIMDYELSLRDSESSMIEVSHERVELDLTWCHCTAGAPNDCSSGCSRSCANPSCTARHWSSTPRIQPVESAAADESQPSIDVVLIGNPNCGKTSLFNAVSGGHERVGNYSGVTVTQKIGHIVYKGYRLNIIDLPGTYSLSAFSPEERYVQYYLRENTPDVVVNVVAASSLKRHLYLTTELIDRDMKMVGALNMYDELQKSGATIDVEQMAQSLGMPLIPTIAKSSQGIEPLLDKVIELVESGERSYPQAEINYGDVIGCELDMLSEKLMEEVDLPVQFPPRYWALKMLERDEQVVEVLSHFEGYREWCRLRDEALQRVDKALDGGDLNTEISAHKYNFIDSVLDKTLSSDGAKGRSMTSVIDSVVTHKWLGFPIFIALMWLTFSATFTLGAYPQEWIESGIEALASMVEGGISDGWLKSLLLDGVLGGAGGVLVFLPNIIILYLFIVIMEGTGYMVRAAFLMDRLMHCVGLDGRSFISMLMGFGCNVPAIMATRTIEDRKSRLITILTNPFMSCSARLPVYILLAGTFFPAHGGAVITMMYVLGIVVAGATALVMARTIKRGEESPLILELPPYRFPTLGSILKQLWHKSEHYIIRIGKVILLASLIIWTLDYFPQNSKSEDESGKGSYLSQIGQVCEPVMQPLGLDWRASVSLVSGVAAKELIVSSLGVLYSTEASSKSQTEDLVEVDGEVVEVGTLRQSFTIPSAVAYMIFVLLYFPCIGTLAAIGGETNKWRWIVISVVYSTTLAWVLAWGAYNILNMFGL